MIKADQFSFPIAFTGSYPNNWAGYTFLQWTQQNAFHPGIDWNWGAGEDDYGKPIQLIANGLCVHQSREDKIGYGIISVFKHELTDQLYNFLKTKYNIDARNIYSFYAHQKDEFVDEGTEYLRGDLIGYVRKSGTGVSHLHQELYKSIPGTSWRYWPTLSQGWTQEKLKQHYIDTYDFIVNQPQISNEDDLAKCKEEVQREKTAKNETHQELVEVKKTIDSLTQTHNNFIDYLIEELRPEGMPDTPPIEKIKGRIEGLKNVEDKLTTILKENESLKSSALENEKVTVTLKEDLVEFKIQNKAQAEELQEVINDNVIFTNRIEELEKNQTITLKRLFGNIYWGVVKK